MSRFVARTILFALLVCCGCSSPAEPNNDEPDAGTHGEDLGSPAEDAGGEQPDVVPEPDVPEPDPVVLPSFSELDEGWTEIFPGGETTCARGGLYSFLVHKGDPDRVAVHYVGGGGCWNKATCQTDDVFTDSLDKFRDTLDLDNDLEGLLDMKNPDNPIYGWTHVIAPYCTGDVHWGNNVADYGDGVIVFHRGAVNAQVVFDWMTREFEAPGKLFVTGCSAGSYGSIMWAAHFARAYPTTRLYQLGDSGAGVTTDSFFADSFANWNADAVFPAWIPALDPAQVDVAASRSSDLYAGIATQYPTQTFSQWNTKEDWNQKLFYSLMGGDQDEWSAQMLALTNDISARAGNYYNWHAPGDPHCVLPYNDFYTHETDGVRLRDWVSSMLADEPIDHISCAECN